MGEACSKPSLSMAFSTSAERPSSENNLVVMQDVLATDFGRRKPRAYIRGNWCDCPTLPPFGNIKILGSFSVCVMLAGLAVYEIPGTWQNRLESFSARIWRLSFRGRLRRH